MKFLTSDDTQQAAAELAAKAKEYGYSYEGTINNESEVYTMLREDTELTIKFRTTEKKIDVFVGARRTDAETGTKTILKHDTWRIRSQRKLEEVVWDMNPQQMEDALA